MSLWVPQKHLRCTTLQSSRHSSLSSGTFNYIMAKGRCKPRSFLQLDLLSQTSRESPPLLPNASERPKKFDCKLLLLYFILYNLQLFTSFGRSKMGKEFNWAGGEMERWETYGLLDIVIYTLGFWNARSGEHHSHTITSYCFRVITGLRCTRGSTEFWHDAVWRRKQNPERVFSLLATNTQLSHNLHFHEFCLFKESTTKIHAFDFDTFKT